jgi:hypothetical protein
MIDRAINDVSGLVHGNGFVDEVLLESNQKLPVSFWTRYAVHTSRPRAILPSLRRRSPAARLVRF